MGRKPCAIANPLAVRSQLRKKSSRRLYFGRIYYKYLFHVKRPVRVHQKQHLFIKNLVASTCFGHSRVILRLCKNVQTKWMNA